MGEELGLVLAPLEYCRDARCLPDRALARPCIANGTSFRRWSLTKRSLRGAGPKNTALGCGGNSRGDNLHSHVRASLPPPFMTTRDAQSLDSAPVWLAPDCCWGHWPLVLASPCAPPHCPAPSVVPRCRL